jgi:hypothetical protein
MAVVQVDGPLQDPGFLGIVLQKRLPRIVSRFGETAKNKVPFLPFLLPQFVFWRRLCQEAITNKE